MQAEAVADLVAALGSVLVLLRPVVEVDLLRITKVQVAGRAVGADVGGAESGPET